MIIKRVVSAVDKGLTTSIKKSNEGPLEQIKQIGFSYIEFFVENPEYFTILFNGDIMGHVFVEDDVLSFDETPIFGIIVQCFKTHREAKQQPFDSSIVLEYWSTVHGLTSLITSQKIVFLDEYREYVSKIIERIARRLE